MQCFETKQYLTFSRLQISGSCKAHRLDNWSFSCHVVAGGVGLEDDRFCTTTWNTSGQIYQLVRHYFGRITYKPSDGISLFRSILLFHSSRTGNGRLLERLSNIVRLREDVPTWKSRMQCDNLEGFGPSIPCNARHLGTAVLRSWTHVIGHALAFLTIRSTAQLHLFCRYTNIKTATLLDIVLDLS